MTSPDAFDDETAGEDLLPLVLGRHGETIATALVGCGFYRDDPDAPATIVECDRGTGQLTVTENGRTRRLGLAAGYVLHPAALRAVIDAALSPVERQARKDRAVLAAFGYSGRIEIDELRLLAAAIEEARAGPVLSRSRRYDVLVLADKYDPEHLGKQFCRAWMAHWTGPVPGDVLIHLTRVLRQSGRIAEALAQTDVLLQREHGLTVNERAILFTQRAALWLDRFEQTQTPQLLDRAERSANQAWKLNQSDECSLVYQRLKKLRSEQADELQAGDAVKRAARHAAAHLGWKLT